MRALSLLGPPSALRSYARKQPLKKGMVSPVLEGEGRARAKRMPMNDGHRSHSSFKAFLHGERARFSRAELLTKHRTRPRRLKRNFFSAVSAFYFDLPTCPKAQKIACFFAVREIFRLEVAERAPPKSDFGSDLKAFSPAAPPHAFQVLSLSGIFPAEKAGNCPLDRQLKKAGKQRLNLG